METLLNVSPNDNKKTEASLIWRRQAVSHLAAKGYQQQAQDLKRCGTSFFVDVCPDHPDHEPKAVAVHCGLRICPECEARESWRKLSRYLPALQALLEPNPLYPDYRLRKIVLTTPYPLSDLTSKSFNDKQKLVNAFCQEYFYQYFLNKGGLTKAELRRQRIDLKQHGIGGLRSSEFGEKGKKLHWHILIYSPYMPHDDILRIWNEVTGGECQIAHVSGLYADKSGEIDDRVGLQLAVKEIVKYATKFTSLRPRDIPKLYSVLKGNRRFQSFGILHGIELPDDETIDRTCSECGASREQTTVTEYIRRCELRHVPIDDVVTDAVDSGIALYCTRDTEITSGKTSVSPHKARDSIEVRV